MLIAPQVYTSSSNPLNLKVQTPGLFLSVGAKTRFGDTPLDLAKGHPEIADLLRKHGGKTGEELKAEGK